MFGFVIWAIQFILQHRRVFIKKKGLIMILSSVKVYRTWQREMVNIFNIVCITTWTISFMVGHLRFRVSAACYDSSIRCRKSKSLHINSKIYSDLSVWIKGVGLGLNPLSDNTKNTGIMKSLLGAQACGNTIATKPSVSG